MKTKDEQIEELKTTAAIHLKVADKLQQQIEALDKPKQWEPRGGAYGYDMVVRRRTKEAAEKASAEMRTHNRLLAYVDEFGGDWEADWAVNGKAKYSLYYDYDSRRWHVDTNHVCCVSGAVYMSQECALGLERKLNSGEVAL